MASSSSSSSSSATQIMGVTDKNGKFLYGYDYSELDVVLKRKLLEDQSQKLSPSKPDSPAAFINAKLKKRALYWENIKPEDVSLKITSYGGNTYYDLLDDSGNILMPISPVCPVEIPVDEFGNTHANPRTASINPKLKQFWKKKPADGVISFLCPMWDPIGRPERLAYYHRLKDFMKIAVETLMRKEKINSLVAMKSERLTKQKTNSCNAVIEMLKEQMSNGEISPDYFEKKQAEQLKIIANYRPSEEEILKLIMLENVSVLKLRGNKTTGKIVGTESFGFECQAFGFVPANEYPTWVANEITARVRPKLEFKKKDKKDDSKKKAAGGDGDGQEEEEEDQKEADEKKALCNKFTKGWWPYEGHKYMDAKGDSEDAKINNRLIRRAWEDYGKKFNPPALQLLYTKEQPEWLNHKFKQKDLLAFQHKLRLSIDKDKIFFHLEIIKVYGCKPGDGTGSFSNSANLKKLADEIDVGDLDEYLAGISGGSNNASSSNKSKTVSLIDDNDFPISSELIKTMEAYEKKTENNNNNQRSSTPIPREPRDNGEVPKDILAQMKKRAADRERADEEEEKKRPKKLSKIIPTIPEENNEMEESDDTKVESQTVLGSTEPTIIDNNGSGMIMMNNNGESDNLYDNDNDNDNDDDEIKPKKNNRSSSRSSRSSSSSSSSTSSRRK